MTDIKLAHYDQTNGEFVKIYPETRNAHEIKDKERSILTLIIGVAFTAILIGAMYLNTASAPDSVRVYINLPFDITCGAIMGGLAIAAMYKGYQLNKLKQMPVRIIDFTQIGA